MQGLDLQDAKSLKHLFIILVDGLFAEQQHRVLLVQHTVQLLPFFDRPAWELGGFCRS